MSINIHYKKQNLEWLSIMQGRYSSFLLPPLISRRYHIEVENIPDFHPAVGIFHLDTKTGLVLQSFAVTPEKGQRLPLINGRRAVKTGHPVIDYVYENLNQFYPLTGKIAAAGEAVKSYIQWCGPVGFTMPCGHKTLYLFHLQKGRLVKVENLSRISARIRGELHRHGWPTKSEFRYRYKGKTYVEYGGDDESESWQNESQLRWLAPPLLKYLFGEDWQDYLWLLGLKKGFERSTGYSYCPSSAVPF